MQKISSCLWFDDKAEEAAKFYTSIFRNSRIVEVSRFGEGGPAPKGAVMAVTFELDGQKFMALNGARRLDFTEAHSLFVSCETQAEVDALWDKLTSDGGAPSMCGWLKDKYGLSWQIIPSALPTLLTQADPKKSQRVMQAMMKMNKIDVAALQRAADEA
jgi:predicted 3-demethylubiquinone-9 3-methyltransferase (glyoxalase superfamily)